MSRTAKGLFLAVAPSHLVLAMVLLTIGCTGGSGGDGPGETGETDATAGTTTTPAATPGAASLDSTGAPLDPCADDYDGHHELASAFPLGLSTTATARAVFGDGVLLGVGNEQGTDHLVACPGAPDFFAVEIACPGYLGVDLRRLGEGELDLHLYADGVELEAVVGTWSGFFLEPLHRWVEPRTYAIEVRHADGFGSPYSLDVVVLPTQPCR